jgi:hypothetical protein
LHTAYIASKLCWGMDIRIYSQTKMFQETLEEKITVADPENG